VGHLEKPDRLIFDLDPDEDLGWHRVIAAAFAVRDLLAKLGLQSFPKTTGGKGLHVVVPIAPTLDWDGAKEFSRAVVAKLASDEPHLYTASLGKQARHGRIFIDYLRNGRGATAVAAFSTRARPGATVSAPLTWQEVETGIRSDQLTILNLALRLRPLRADPWVDFAAVKQKISAAAARRLLKRLRASAAARAVAQSFPQPPGDLVLDGPVDACLRNAGALEDIERMITALNDEEVGCRLERAEDRPQFLRRAERIA
jgi:DNA primase